MLSMVIPAYNEAANIETTINEIINALSTTPYHENYEIIVVDDHSDDHTYQVVAEMDNLHVHCLRLSRRSGSHTALRAGLTHAKGEGVICISADGQDTPTAIPKMIQKWHDGNHIVWALRHIREETWQVKFFAMLFYKLLTILTSNSSNEIDLSRADFYLLDRRVIDAINVSQERNTSLFGLIVWSGFQQEFVEYERRARRSGKSKWNFKSRFRLASDWIIAFSGLPLKLMTITGFMVASLGFLYTIFLIINALVGNPAEGWSSVMVAILVLGGLQMLMFGIMGEYIWRNLDESRKRPLYFIEKSTKWI